MMVDGIGLGLLKAGDFLVLCQKVCELFSQIMFGQIPLGQNLPKLRRVKHRYFTLATPAP